MNIRSLFIFVLLFGTSLSAAAQTCQELFKIDSAAWVHHDFDWKSLEWDATSLVSPLKIPMDQLRFFSSPEGSLGLIIKSTYRHDHQGMGLLARNMYYRVFEGESFNFGHMGDVLDFLVANEGVLAKAKRGDWGAKRVIASSLLTMQNVFRRVLKDPELHLLSAKGLLKVYGLIDAKKFNEELALTRRGLDGLGKLVAYQRTLEDPVRALSREVAFEITGPVYLAGIRQDGIVKSVRIENYISRVITLIEKLHLPAARQKMFIDSYNKYLNTNWNSHGPRQGIEWSRWLEQLNFFIRAYVEKFPKEQSTPAVRRMSSIWFINAVSTAEKFDQVYQINEQRLAENLDTAVALNTQIDSVVGEVESAFQTHSRLKYRDEKFEKELEEIRAGLLALRVSELTTEKLNSRIEDLKMLQFRLSQAVEKILNNVDHENIQTFLELNFSWARVIADKSYEISGRDYDQVVFGKDVVSYFKHEQLLGDRSLAALNKGYVGRHGESGLRFISEIHKDLRYIKLMKGRKVRLIGRLKNRKITFFAIYDRDEAFDQNWLRHLIESH